MNIVSRNCSKYLFTFEFFPKAHPIYKTVFVKANTSET